MSGNEHGDSSPGTAPTFSCPLPHTQPGHVTLAHGGGGSMMNRLIEGVFLHAFRNDILDRRLDASVLDVGGARIAFTTDSFVVQPLFFPGGDIGSLAVHGTVNDLAMSGARPLYLSAGFILEEGLPLEQLQRIVESMQRAAVEAGVTIVTGDTKVVDRGSGDGVFINTAGVGLVEHGRDLDPRQLRLGDRVIVSGDLGRHGIAVMACREGLEFKSEIESDSAPLNGAVQALLQSGVQVRCLRDLTRGGLASALNEFVAAAGRSIHVRERDIPVRDDVRGACEILGLDPLYVANEGRFVAVVAPGDAEKALAILGKYCVDTHPALVGEVVEDASPRVTLESVIGASRILDMLSGEQLPRIC